jgi:hypothetical protein
VCGLDKRTQAIRYMYGVFSSQKQAMKYIDYRRKGMEGMKMQIYLTYFQQRLNQRMDEVKF